MQFGYNMDTDLWSLKDMNTTRYLTSLQIPQIMYHMNSRNCVSMKIVHEIIEGS